MAKKHFTYTVACSFEMQFTFSESEVEQSDEGAEGNMSPTDAALEALCHEIEEHLDEHFGAVKNVEAWADFDDLLGIEEDERRPGESSKRKRKRRR
jgi:hypothetical protein